MGSLAVLLEAIPTLGFGEVVLQFSTSEMQTADHLPRLVALGGEGCVLLPKSLVFLPCLFDHQNCLGRSHLHDHFSFAPHQRNGAGSINRLWFLLAHLPSSFRSRCNSFMFSSNTHRSSSMSCVAFGVAPLKPRVWARMRSDFCASVMAQVLLNMASLLVGVV